MDKLGYKFNVVNSKVDGFGKVKSRTYELVKQNKKTINMNSLKTIVDSLEEEARKKGKNIKILVTGVSAIGANMCLKSFDETTDEMLERDDDYYNGMVRDASKFENFYKCGIHILYMN